MAVDKVGTLAGQRRGRAGARPRPRRLARPSSSRTAAAVLPGRRSPCRAACTAATCGRSSRACSPAGSASTPTTSSTRPPRSPSRTPASSSAARCCARSRSCAAASPPRRPERRRHRRRPGRAGRRPPAPDPLVERLRQLRSGDPALVRAALPASPEPEPALVAALLPLLASDELFADVLRALRRAAPRVDRPARGRAARPRRRPGGAPADPPRAEGLPHRPGGRGPRRGARRPLVRRAHVGHRRPRGPPRAQRRRPHLPRGRARAASAASSTPESPSTASCRSCSRCSR